MKSNTDRDRKIFELWKKGKSFSELANIEIKSEISLKRVRNIIYGGVKKLRSNYEKDLYIAFVNNLKKTIGEKRMAEIIRQTWLNQPTHNLSERRIREIINKELNNQ